MTAEQGMQKPLVLQAYTEANKWVKQSANADQRLFTAGDGKLHAKIDTALEKPLNRLVPENPPDIQEASEDLPIDCGSQQQKRFSGLSYT